MGRYSKKRYIKTFRKGPIPNLCFSLAVIAFVAGVLGTFALIDKAKVLPFTLNSFVPGMCWLSSGKISRYVRTNRAASSNIVKQEWWTVIKNTQI